MRYRSMRGLIYLALVFVVSLPLRAQQNREMIPADVQSLAPQDVQGFDQNSPAVKKLLESALDLTTKNLGYKYGSAEPSQGGMDCSGTIYYLLQQAGLQDVPRSSDEQYAWARKVGNFQAVLSRKIDSFELNSLHPGDLLFWTGTYNVDRDIPITHTMIYLGLAKSDGQPLMVGCSDGRTYRGRKKFGVSVFDFKVAPREGSPSRFVGYARIPGLAQTELTTIEKQPAADSTDR